MLMLIDLKERMRDGHNSVLANHIERWQASGLTPAAYCEQAGLNPRTLSARWSDDRRQQPPEVALIPVELEDSQRPPTGSDELRIGEANRAVPTLVLHCRQGHRLELPLSISAVWLKGLS
jgi:hypothetical protein